MVKLNWLHAFVVFTDMLNMTRAARALHISQPALHAQLANLSEALGVPLYRRQGRKLVLTAEGGEVACFAREMVERVAVFRDRLRTGDDGQPVVLAAGEGTYLYLIGDAIRCFQQVSTAPLSLLTLDQRGCLETLRSGRAHLAVTMLESPPPDLEARLLARFEMVVVAPTGHRLERLGRRLSLTDLEGEHLVMPPVQRPHGQLLARALQDAGVAWRLAVEASGWPLTLHFVHLGVGIAVVNGCCRLPPGLTALPLQGLPGTSYHLLSRPGAHRREAVRVLRQSLQTIARPAANAGCGFALAND